MSDLQAATQSLNDILADVGAMLDDGELDRAGYSFRDVERIVRGRIVAETPLGARLDGLLEAMHRAFDGEQLAAARSAFFQLVSLVREP
jgi:hypothetical protein